MKIKLRNEINKITTYLFEIKLIRLLTKHGYDVLFL